MFDLNGKVAIVTGAASGIGLATAEALLDKGAKVVLSDHNIEVLEALEKKLTDQSGNMMFVMANVSRERDIRRLIGETVKNYGRIDIMVNNAGIGNLASTHELSFKDYNKVIEINLNGVFFGCKYAIREMLNTRGGVIINVSSILGFVGQSGAFAYSATKGAVNTLTKSLALEYAENRIRVNAVCPGYVETGMVNKETLGDYYDSIVSQHPMSRIGTPEEIAHAIIFLCENEFVTGTNLLIDGGYTAK